MRKHTFDRGYTSSDPSHCVRAVFCEDNLIVTLATINRIRSGKLTCFKQELIVTRTTLQIINATTISTCVAIANDNIVTSTTDQSIVAVTANEGNTTGQSRCIDIGGVCTCLVHIGRINRHSCRVSVECRTVPNSICVVTAIEIDGLKARNVGQSGRIAVR